MGIENFVETLYLPEEALTLCEGKLRSRSVVGYSVLDDSSVLEAAEILIAINDADNLCSRSDVVERAMFYGWRPTGIETVESASNVKVIYESRQPVPSGWRKMMFKTAKFLLKVSST